LLEIYDNACSATLTCRRPMKMSLLCQLEMTLPGAFSGGVRGDGSADERWGAVASGSAARSGSATVDDGGRGAAVGARATSGVPAAEGVPGRGCGRPDLEETRVPQQPTQARGSAASSAGSNS